MAISAVTLLFSMIISHKITSYCPGKVKPENIYGMSAVISFDDYAASKSKYNNDFYKGNIDDFVKNKKFLFTNVLSIRS